MDVSVTETLGFQAPFPLAIFASFHQAELGFFILLKMDFETLCQLDGALENYC